MPTNYNFTTDLNHWDLTLPNTAKGGPKLKRYLEIISLNNGGTTGWETQSTGISTGTMSIDYTQRSPLGNYPLKFTSTGTAGVQSEYFNSPKLIQILPPNSTDTYYSKLWFKSDLANGTVFNTLLFNSGGAGGGLGITTANTWYNVYGDAVGVAGEIQNASILIRIDSPLIGQNYWFDLEYIKRQSRTLIGFDYVYTDLDPKTTKSFDNQFIPADTFRQGNLLVWGQTLQSGNPSRNNTIGVAVPYGIYYSSPLVVQTRTNKIWKDVSRNSKNNSVALDSSGQAWYWGFGAYPNTTTGGTSTSTPVLSNSGYTWKVIETSSYAPGTSVLRHFGAGIKSDGTLLTWGYNEYGVLGIGITSPSNSTLVQELTSSSNWKFVTTGYTSVHAIKNDGTLWSWGQNQYGQLGTNDLFDRWSPTQEFTSSNNWKFVSAGINIVSAIKSDGTLWLWGQGSRGAGSDQGLFTGQFRSRPFRENTFRTDWKKVVVDYYGDGGGLGAATLAITNSGDAYRWGLFALGNSSGGNYDTPVPFANNQGVKWRDIHGGYEQVFLVSTDGYLWGLGANSDHEISPDDLSFRATPIPIYNISNVKKITIQPNFFGNNSVRVIRYIDPII